ncbi:MAG: hypothetical protein K0R14_1213 [Burkholderiales bacterium]|jgi:hypothetical protein|nr:hypothetical protein [Burkholderiales bacterium]
MSTFVFLGPSLDINNAKSVFPEANYLPPVACGDIIQVMNLGARRIVIIDGYFESQPSVWHKEILYAISAGITVYGASSMGALRAAELNDFGMIGVGEIYNKYKHEEIVDDDEVALLHLTEENNFKPYSLPMINIRLTVWHALELELITPDFAIEFLTIAKNIFYKERTEKVLKVKTIHLINVQSFFVWFKDNYIDQKEIDAKKVLSVARSKLLRSNPSQANKSIFSDTALFRNLKLENLAIPFRTFKEWLPIEAKFYILAKLFDEYPISKQIAKAIGVLHEIGCIIIKGHELVFLNPAFLDSKLSKQNCSCFMKLLINNPQNNIENTSAEILAKIAVYLYEYLCRSFNIIDERTTLRITQQFYLKKNIDSKEKFVAWLEQNNMNINEFKTAMQLLHIYDYFILQNNLSTLIKARNKDLYDYFSIAISLNGLDKKILQSFTYKKYELITQCLQLLAAENDLYAIAHDFNDAFTMRNFLKEISNSNTGWISNVSLMSWKLQ